MFSECCNHEFFLCEEKTWVTKKVEGLIPGYKSSCQSVTGCSASYVYPERSKSFVLNITLD